jgi:thiosulfate reductase/polysulfide reductase chain A
VFQLYDPDRLRYPLIRDGERGSGKFRKVTWDEVLQFAADKFQEVISKHGPQAIAMFAHGSSQQAFIALMNMMGAKNIAIPSYSQCLGSREVGWYGTYGVVFNGRESFDGINSKAMMFIGRNVLEAVQVGEAKRVIAAMEKGAKLIYADPRFTKTAAKADHWLQIKPGTDMALTLGMIAYIIKNELYNKEFIEKYTTGIDELSEHVRDISLEWTANETGIDEQQIIDVVNILTEAAPRAFVHPGRRVSRYGDDVQMTRTIAILNALLGNWQHPGGVVTMNPIGIKIPAMVRYYEGKADYERADGAGSTYPLTPTNMGLVNGIIEAIRTEKPYPIKALIAFGVNPFLHAANYDSIKEMMNKLDFVLSSDIYLNETALYADIILPESSYLERADPIAPTAYMTPFIQYRQKATEPIGDTKSAWDMVKILAEKMNYETEWRTIDEVTDLVSADLGITVDTLKEDGVYVKNELLRNSFLLSNGEHYEFNTYSGMIELYSYTFEDSWADPLPSYTAHPQPKEDEFRLLTGRLSWHTHARTQNIRPLLALQDFKVEIWVPENRAKTMGIKNGDRVFITKGNKRSKVMVALVTDKIHESALFIPHGFGRFSPFMKEAFAMAGASSANFSSNDVDSISGAAAFHNSFVKIEKAR